MRRCKTFFDVSLLFALCFAARIGMARARNLRPSPRRRARPNPSPSRSSEKNLAACQRYRAPQPIQPRANEAGEGAREKALDKAEDDVIDNTAAHPAGWAHKVKGRVAAIDHNTGIVSIEAANPEKPLALQFTPQSVANLTVGETILTRTSYAKEKPAELSAEDGGGMPPTANKLKDESGRRFVTGTVTSIERATGRVTLRNEDTETLYVELPPNFAEHLTEGDRVNLEMAFSRDVEQKG